MKPTPNVRLPAWAWLLIGVFALLLVAAALHDFGAGGKFGAGQVVDPPAVEVVNALRALGAERATATNGMFSLPAPQGWQQKTGDEALPYDITFYTPNGASIRAMSAPVAYNDLPSLDRVIRRKEHSRDLSTVIEVARVGERPMIQRRITLVSQRVLALDFVEDHVEYHLLASAPKELYDIYEPLFFAVGQGLRTRSQATPAADASQTNGPGIPDTP